MSFPLSSLDIEISRITAPDTFFGSIVNSFACPLRNSETNVDWLSPLSEASFPLWI